MSKRLSVESLLSAFPYALSGDEKISMLASIVAESLMNLYDDNELELIYACIDRLDSTMLDILAYDFKIDWWDVEASVEEKRKTFKAHWEVHRKLGTPGAVRTAISTIYESTNISEWYEYGGKPYHFKIVVDLGAILGIECITDQHDLIHIQTCSPQMFSDTVVRNCFLLEVVGHDPFCSKLRQSIGGLANQKLQYRIPKELQPLVGFHGIEGLLIVLLCERVVREGCLEDTDLIPVGVQAERFPGQELP